MLDNFNRKTAYETFPNPDAVFATLKIGNPVQGDAGFIVWTKEGKAYWAPSLEVALGTAQNDAAVYPAFQVNSYYYGFAHDVLYNPKTGVTTMEGNLPPQ